MAEDKIRIPASGGGLTRFNEDSDTRIRLSPGAVIIFCIAVIIIIAVLHYFGGKFLA